MANDNDLVQKWNGRYRETQQAPRALDVLVVNQHLLPDGGTALDLACGLGGSGLLLAERGLQTWAWDLSAVAIDALSRRAAGLPLFAEVRDVIDEPPEPNRFDVICVGHFLDRGLCPQIAASLRPGGLLFYQTFSLERVDETGPDNPDYRLAANELLDLFPDLLVRFYRDEGTLGDRSRGFRKLSQLVAQQRL